VINGDDDREELYELTRSEARETLTRSVAALFWAHRIDYADPTELRALSLQKALGVCGDVRFADQPAAAACSATLIDDDLVLTAGHCLGYRPEDGPELCQRLLVVFGYHYLAPGELALTAGGEGIFACRRVVHYEKSSSGENFRDLAILQLDRPVGSERQPVPIANQTPKVGEALIAASHGAGLPLKVDQGGEVIAVPSGADYLVASTDSFAGGSGAPLFDTALQFVGHQVRGAADWENEGDCARPARSEKPAEEHQLVAASIQALCDGGWPSQRLCRTPSACGDGMCTGTETNGNCGRDCAAASCGDGLCEPSERAACAQDCRAYLDVPADHLDYPGSLSEPGLAPAAPSSVSGGCGIRRAHNGARSAPVTLLLSLGGLVSCLRVQASLRRRRRLLHAAHAQKRTAIVDSEPA
jgi:hypothetical protein